VENVYDSSGHWDAELFDEDCDGTNDWCIIVTLRDPLGCMLERVTDEGCDGIYEECESFTHDCP